MSYHGHTCAKSGLPAMQRPVGPCEMCDYERAMDENSAFNTELDEFAAKVRASTVLNAEDFAVRINARDDDPPAAEREGAEQRIERIRAELDEVVRRGGWHVRNARNDIPWLLSALLAARRENERMQFALRAIVDGTQYSRQPLERQLCELARVALAATQERCRWCDLIHDGGPENCDTATQETR